MSETQSPDDIIDIEPKVIDAPKASERRGFLLSFAAPAAIAVIAAVAGGWFYRDWLVGYLPPDQVQALSTRVAAIETSSKDSQKRVDAVVALTEELKAKLSAAQSAAEKSAKQNADAAGQMQANAASLADLKQAVDKLSAATAELQARPAGSGGADPAIGARLAQLEKQVAAGPVAAAVPDLSGNLKDLKAQAQQGQGFADALAPMARAIPGAPGLDVLGAERGGLANAATLAAELDALRSSLPKAAVPTPESGWWASVKGVFSKLVRVKGTGGEDWALAAAKASAFAAAGDLEQAAAQFPKADANVPAPLRAWADKAQRRIALDKSIEVFSAALARAGLAKE